MTSDEASVIHIAAFTLERGWSTAEIDALLENPNVAFFYRADGFALVRCVADEAELLTLAVAPRAQRQGIGRALMLDWMRKVAATIAFLEVAADNHAALKLYAQLGFKEFGRRKNYYARGAEIAVDALTLRADLASARAC
ncbi:MAG: GNAT family N-acetyltransferase [Pseudomonadota bacterium]